MYPGYITNFLHSNLALSSLYRPLVKASSGDPADDSVRLYCSILVRDAWNSTSGAFSFLQASLPANEGKKPPMQVFGQRTCHPIRTVTC